MLKLISRIVSIFFLIGFIACKKDNSNTAASSLSGNWTFDHIHAITSATAIDSGNGFNSKIITTSDYTTIENGGSVNISGNTMAGTGITYSANMLLFASEYEGDVLIDTFSTLLPVTIPATSSSSTFEVIGQDSLHYTGAGLFGSGGSGSPASTGAKFTVSGNTLTLTSFVIKDEILDQGGGETVSQHETAEVIVTLIKQ